MKKLAAIALILCSIYTFAGARQADAISGASPRIENTRPDAPLSINEAVDFIFENYPEAHLRDVYKSFFQDHFGPLHISASPESVRAYLLSELAEMDAEDSVTTTLSSNGWEYAGQSNNYIRMDLDPLIDDDDAQEEFISLFLKSCSPVTPKMVEDWKRLWPQIQQYVQQTYPDIPEFQKDADEIALILKQDTRQLITSNAYAIHHSPQYERAYHPHYRLIKRSLLH